MASGSVRRIETESEVSAYLAKMKHALENGAQIQFQIDHQVDNERDAYFTNRFTLSELFPDEAPSEVFRRELMTLTKANYMGTVRDIRFPKRSEMREFGKIYRQSDEVYIKVRIELLNSAEGGNHTAFVMSFHFAETPFSQCTFPYKK